MKSQLKKLTARSNGMGYSRRKWKLKAYIRGRIGYYHLANMKRFLLDTDEWLRRRIRMCIWNSWKYPKIRVLNLIKCEIPYLQSYRWGNTSLRSWRIALSYLATRAMPKDKLRVAGYQFLYDEYLKWCPK